MRLSERKQGGLSVNLRKPLAFTYWVEEVKPEKETGEIVRVGLLDWTEQEQ